MSRDIDPRDAAPAREDRSREAGHLRDAATDPRAVFARDLDLPRGASRERVQTREHDVELRGSEARALATIGAFRVVPAGDLRDDDGRPLDARTGTLRHLRDAGLVRTTPYLIGRTRTTIVTLTDRGRELLERARRPSSGDSAQRFYDGIVRPRELAHDAMVYRAYTRSAERLVSRGATIRRAVLDHELKRDYQRFLQEQNRGRPLATGHPTRDRDDIERWAMDHGLPYRDGHIQFPDVRIEYETADGEVRTEDVEVETPHYRGAHAAGKAASGFTRYNASGMRVGGRGGSARGSAPFDPHAAEDLV